MGVTRNSDPTTWALLGVVLGWTWDCGLWPWRGAWCDCGVARLPTYQPALAPTSALDKP
jgi:hypothetical protein